MALTVAEMGGIQTAAYEHMKALAGEVELAARLAHSTQSHPGQLHACTFPQCAHWVKMIRWSSHLERCREFPDYQRRNATYEEITEGTPAR